MTSAVLITGATSAIGRAIARTVSEQHTVILHFHQQQHAAQSLRNEISEVGGRSEVLQADLSDPGAHEVVAAFVSQLMDAKQLSLHGVVHNAAMVIGPRVGEITPAAFDDFMHLNVRAPLLLSQSLLHLMSPGGSIVNVSSASAHISSPGNLLYAMSKSAVESMTRNLAAAVAVRGVRVNAVVPGYTDNGHAAFRDPNALAYMSGLSALGGVAEPEHVAEAVAFLLSSASPRTTGSLLDVTGGMSLSPRPQRGASSVRDLLPTMDAPR